MPAPAPPFGPKNTFLHVLAGAFAPSSPPVYGDVVGSGNVIVGLGATDFTTNKVGNVINVGDIGQTPNPIEQGYLGDDTPDSVAGATGRPPVTVTTRMGNSGALQESDIGTVYTVAVSRKKGANATIKAFTGELAGFVETTPEGGIVQTTLTFAPQGDNVQVSTP